MPIAVLVACLVAAALVGCGGDMACVQWSQAEGQCPARAEARRYMAPQCEEPIVSVDSDGEFDGQACCYDVTKGDTSTCTKGGIEE